MVRVSARSSWPRRVLPAFLLFLCFSSVSLFPFQLLNDCRHPAKFGTWKFDWMEGESGNSARLDWTNNTRNYLIRRTEFICLCDFHWFSLLISHSVIRCYFGRSRLLMADSGQRVFAMKNGEEISSGSSGIPIPSSSPSKIETFDYLHDPFGFLYCLI